jgi:hypothetical protein
MFSFLENDCHSKVISLLKKLHEYGILLLNYEHLRENTFWNKVYLAILIYLFIS